MEININGGSHITLVENNYGTLHIHPDAHHCAQTLAEYVECEDVSQVPDAQTDAPAKGSADAAPSLPEEKSETTTPALPEAFGTPEANALFGKLRAAGLVDERWQPVGLSWSQRGCLASTVAKRLGIAEVWKSFGQLWSANPEAIRSGFNRSMEQKKTFAFQDELKNILK